MKDNSILPWLILGAVFGTNIGLNVSLKMHKEEIKNELIQIRRSIQNQHNEKLKDNQNTKG